MKLLCMAFFMSMCSAFAQTPVYTGAINGLTVVVEFSDAPFIEPLDSIDKMMNQPGFVGWGNVGSVRDFYYAQSDGKTTLTTTVVKVSLPNPVSYYYGGPGRDLSDILDAVNAKYPAGFQNLTINPVNGTIKHFNILNKAGKGGWAFGPQPGTNFIKNNGVNLVVAAGNFSSYGATEKPHTSVVCHETGHSTFNWTDYYATAFCNLGNFDVMASAGSEIAAMPVNPALRKQRGWITTVTEISGTTTAQYTLTANSYSQIHKYTNPNNAKEYLLFHALKHGGYYQSVVGGMTMPEGLAIWYVNEDMGYDTPGQGDQYYVRLVQADNKDEMHDEDVPADVRGDAEDLYGNANTSFPNGHPLRWKDGGEFGISISNITKSGNTVTFTVNGRPSTANATSDIFGTLSPKGIISVASGGSKSFTFIPKIGYDLDVVKVNGTQVTATNPYTLTGISGTKTINATFKRKATIPALPTPWLKADIGTSSAAGFAAQESGKFNVESYGGSMGGTVDNINFVYQTLNGNGSIIARVAEYNLPTTSNFVGVMMRASLQSNAAQTCIAKTPYAGVAVYQRNNTGDWLVGNPNGIGGLHVYQLYNWLKITRTGNEIMSYCSRDGVKWIIMGQQTINLPTQVLVGMCVAGGTATYPSNVLFDNVSTSTNSACTFIGTKLSGTVIGTDGSWGGSGNTRDKAFDNNVFTYFDAPEDIAWAGLDLGAAYKVTGIRFVPRQGLTYRMMNGKFQGSNTADFSSGVIDLYTVTADPAFDWNCVTITNTSTFKYLRYICAVGGVGNVGEIEFYGTPANVAPTVSITSPANNATFIPPASITIAATAADADGTISNVQFYNGTTLLGSDATSPYSFTWANVAAGTYSITVKATDNAGAVTTSAVVSVTVSSSTADVSGPACGSNNTTLLYQLSAAKMTNATSYNWWYTGSAQSITAVSGANYKANLVTGSNFGTGQVCVGVNYSVSPWYASYCVSVAKCAGAREDEMGTTLNTIAFQNPFTNATTITLADANQTAKIQVYNANGVMIQEAIATGSYLFGGDLNTGLYVLRINIDGKTETIKLIKE